VEHFTRDLTIPEEAEFISRSNLCRRTLKPKAGTDEKVPCIRTLRLSEQSPVRKRVEFGRIVESTGKERSPATVMKQRAGGWGAEFWSGERDM